MAANRRFPEWTRAELDALSTAYLAGRQWAEITRRVNLVGGHNRSREAVRMRGRYLELTKGKPRAWNRRDDILDDVEDLMILGYGRNAMARELGASTKAIDTAINRQTPNRRTAWQNRHTARS